MEQDNAIGTDNILLLFCKNNTESYYTLNIAMISSCEFLHGAWDLLMEGHFFSPYPAVQMFSESGKKLRRNEGRVEMD